MLYVILDQPMAEIGSLTNRFYRSLRSLQNDKRSMCHAGVPTKDAIVPAQVSERLLQHDTCYSLSSWNDPPTGGD